MNAGIYGEYIPQGEISFLIKIKGKSIFMPITQESLNTWYFHLELGDYKSSRFTFPSKEEFPNTKEAYEACMTVITFQWDILKKYFDGGDMKPCACHLRQTTCVNGTGTCMAEPLVEDMK